MTSNISTFLEFVLEFVKGNEKNIGGFSRSLLSCLCFFVPTVAPSPLQGRRRGEGAQGYRAFLFDWSPLTIEYAFSIPYGFSERESVI